LGLGLYGLFYFGGKESMMLAGNNVLVIGGAGFIGSNLVNRLVVDSARVRATLHERAPYARNARAEYVRCDLLQPEDCARACTDMDYVFLCAANTSGAAVMETTPLVHLTPNVIMNARMLEAAYAAGVCKTLFISTNTVYPVSDQPVRETDVTNEFFEKYFIVAWMKRFSEIMCEMYASKIKKPMQTVVVRPANVYGPMDDFARETSHVLPALIRRVVERHDPITVWGDGRDVKDFIYVDDLVQGLLLAMHRIMVYRQFTRNQTIASFLAGLGYMEKRGKGILKMMRLSELNDLKCHFSLTDDKGEFVVRFTP